MEDAALIGLILFIISEILPFTPLKGNGIVDEALKIGRSLFPHKSNTNKRSEGSRRVRKGS